MIILGISDNHEAHACILKNGKLLACIAEERLTRLKADTGYPFKSINKVLEITKVKPKDIDLVVFAGYRAAMFYSLIKPSALFSVQDWLDQCENYWKPLLIENKKISPINDYLYWEKKKPIIKKSYYYEFAQRAKKSDPKNHATIINEVRKKVASKHLKIEKKKIIFARHETCHQYYGLYSQQKFNKNSIIFTLEGGGDDSSATISIIKDKNLKEVFKTNEAMIGRLYRYVTLLLGMKPGQHEYKVMGLAPYGQEYHGLNSLKHFRKYNKVIGTKIINLKIFKDTFYSSKDKLLGERFDGIAWGLQKFTEEIKKKWTENTIKKYKIKNIIYSGGVAQNVKALMELFKIKNLKSLWAGPIPGDGSLAIGAAWYISNKFDKKRKILGLESIYLGSKINEKDITLELKKISKKFKIIKNVNNIKIAKWLSKGLVVARCAGRMEFGQRSLGNRSILADPRRLDTVERINSKIKYRDFWMPFAPSILFEHCSKILENPKKIYSPFMSIAFETKKKFHSLIPAVLHPADKTTRPQMLKKVNNPEYYDLIKKFKSITKIPLLLNTSFNLHGDAIVENASQAIYTFKNSDLDILILNKTAIIRREKINEKNI